MPSNSFIIEYIDQQGNGVYKQNGQTYLIPKTLKGEEGTLKVVKSKGQINYCILTKISAPSPQRSTSECAHFDQCMGCQFLHTDYDTELKLKQENLKESLSYYKIEKEVQLLVDQNRFKVRNRIQLHYDLKKKEIGFINSFTNSITPIKNCIVANELIQNKISELLTLDLWAHFVPSNSPRRGHIELYNKEENHVEVNWNKPYAHGGFTQVHPELNIKVQNQILEIAKEQKFSKVLELFAGDGNLTNKMQLKKRVCVDYYTESSKDFVSLDLYSEKALEKFNEEHKSSFDTLILDPPRAGHKNLFQWVEKFCPEKMLYISCNYHTMLRDISKLDTYVIEQIYLIDFFPGTYHFEVMVLLKKEVLQTAS